MFFLGSIIIREDPLVIGSMESKSLAVCVGFCRKLGDKAMKCSQWPVCRQQNCWVEGSQHANAGECDLQKKAGSRVSVKFALWTASGVYESIMVLRCLSLCEKDPSKWPKLMEIKDSTGSSRRKFLSDTAEATEGVNLDINGCQMSLKIRSPSSAIPAYLANSFKLLKIDSIRFDGLLVSLVLLNIHFSFKQMTYTS